MISSIYSFVRNNGILIVVFLCAFLINPFNLGFILGYPLVALILSKKSFLLKNLDADFAILLLLSLVYAAFYALDPKGGIQFVIVYATFPPTFYLLGKYLFKNLKKTDNAIYLLLVLGFIFSFSGLISVLTNFFEGGFAQRDRSLPNIWTGNLVPATIMGSFFTLNMCLPAVLIADQGRIKVLHKIIGVVIFILSLICVIRLGSRTQLVLMLITTIISLFYVVPRQSSRRTVVMLMMLTGLIFYIYSNVSFDLNEDWLSTFAGRMEKSGAQDIASGGGRTERWAKSIEYIFKKPLGWDAEEFGHAHNLWLDVLRVAGVIPFGLLIIFSFRSVRNIIKTLKKKGNGPTFNVLILVYALAMFLVFMVEPIYEGIFELFALFCLFMGVINKYRTTQPVNP